MFRHVVLMTWQDGVPEEQVRAVLDGLRLLPGEIPEIRSFSFGTDAAMSEGNADIAVVADFDDEEDYLAYASHPAHLALITEYIRPILGARHAVQYRQDETTRAGSTRGQSSA